ncbi:MAG: S41 family peptidase [Bacteroidota bacterium]|nr:S41 family peptidase [Bacteroidota bacterium]
MSKKLKNIAIALLLISAPILTAFKTADNYFEISKNLEIFTSVVNEINGYYVEKVEPAKLLRIGIDAMLNSLDPYTNFYSESEIEDYRFMTTGQYGGIGATIQRKDDYVMIAEPYEGFPAQKADVRGGDVLLEIDGKSTKGKNTDEVSKMLKGQPSSEVKLLIKREGEKNTIVKVVKREEIKVKNVPYYGMVTPQVGYIKFTGFRQQASDEVATALQSLKRDNPSITGVVFDLRGNPGGLLDEAIKTVNIFIDKGQLVVATKGKVEDWNKNYNTDQEALDTKIPVVVLIDGGSASAAEIVSGSLQDLDRAIVVGSNSYGKGLVQTTRPLPYNTQIKITTSKYYIPSGRCIQAVDYGKKDEKGKAYKLPDSLKTAFKTKAGRQVFDGTGIHPDVDIIRPEYSDVLISIYSKQFIFDYATIYRSKHASIENAKEFKLTDADFDDFLKYLNDKDYQYITETETELTKLETSAKDEKYYNAVKAEIDLIHTKLKTDKKNDVIKHKKEIVEFLEEEIASRYYYAAGRIQASWKYDPDVKEALLILAAPDKYKKILTASK